MDDDSRLKTELAPLEQALLAAARDHAGTRLDQAKRQATAIKEKAASRAKALTERAANEGAQAAEHTAQLRLVEARRQARTLVLGAERTAYELLLEQAVSAAGELRKRPEYEALERRLVDAVHTVLGSEAKITRDPDGRGGVEGRDGRRLIDLTLPTLARRCVARLGGDVLRLWS